MYAPNSSEGILVQAHFGGIRNEHQEDGKPGFSTYSSHESSVVISN